MEIPTPDITLQHQDFDLISHSEMPSSTGSRILENRFGRRLLGIFTAVGLVAGGASVVEAPAYADSSLTYTVDDVNAAGGVYARTKPNTDATPMVAGNGVYPGDTVKLICGVTDGTPVGPYGNTTWHYLSDLSRPDEGDFWVNDHYLDTPNIPGQLTPAETKCEDTSAPKSIFFSPIPGAPHALAGLKGVANIDYSLEDWSSGDCSDARVKKDLQSMPPTVDTLSGWSRGRLGPGYFLETATTEQKNQIHTIILFDPGNTSDFTGGGCETSSGQNHDFNALYADWVQSNPENRLMIYTGAVTEEGPAGPDTQISFDGQITDGALKTKRLTFAGLWKYYLAGAWNQPFANQVQICDYDSMDHAEVLRNFAYTVQHPQNECPVAPNGQKAVAWNP